MMITMLIILVIHIVLITAMITVLRVLNLRIIGTAAGIVHRVVIIPTMMTMIMTGAGAMIHGTIAHMTGTVIGNSDII
jgi:hypothetical protein